MIRKYIYSLLLFFIVVSFEMVFAQVADGMKQDNHDNKLYPFEKLIDSESYTGTVSILSGSQIENTAFNNTKNSLAGYIPGLYVSQGGGEPGAEWSTMYIRGKRTTANGTNSPYILVDGFEREMNYMDPKEIESITILKDAVATAMYGLKGASGVIEIKTKRGYVGETRIAFDSQLTLKHALNIPKALGAVDYMKAYNEARENDGYPANFYPEALIHNYQTTTDQYLYPNVAWLNTFFNENSYKQRYSLTIDGGSKLAKYYVLFSYLGDNGNLATNKLINSYSTQNRWDKYNIRTNFDVQITPNLCLQAGLSSMFGFVNNPSNTTGSAMYKNLLNYIPIAHPIMNEDQSISGTQLYMSNPYKIINYGGYSESFTRFVTATTKLQWDLSNSIQGLSTYVAMAYDYNYTQTSRRLKESAVYEIILEGGIPKLDADENRIYRQWGNDTPLAFSNVPGTYYRRMNYELGFNYQRSFDKHDISARLFGFNYLFENDVQLTHAMRGINGAVNYAYNNRYLLSLAGSWSGTEQFPPERRMFLYPAVGLGWIASNENFLKENSILSYLKLNFSYGLAGSDNISDSGSELYYYYLMTLQKGGNAFLGEGNPASITAGNFSTGYLEGVIRNPILRPESTEKKEIALETRFLNDRLSSSFNLFSEYTRYILAFSKSMPGLMGVPNNRLMLENIGEMSNKGFEFQLGWTDRIGHFNYYVDANLTYAVNKVEYLDEEPDIPEPKTGYPIDAYWGFKTSGFFNSDAEVAAWADQSSIGRTTKGDLKYVNQNPDEDNIIDEYDRVYLGTIGMPDWFYGIHAGLKYQRWEVSCLFQGVAGLNRVFRDGINRPFSNSGNIYDFQQGKYWTEEHASQAVYPRLTIDGSSSTKGKSDFWIKDASYLRLKNVELAYTMPTRWITANSSLRLYVSGTNVFSLDKLDGIVDPDISSDGQAYPVNSMFSFGLKLQL
ncbi:MAG: SusC/RagA family TonB-linked outer membrane protein [Pigmentiphaga sp.]|nr:SusC/RagA family TonB-linked outer membrane protein [Pigmentiphaga sp.]